MEEALQLLLECDSIPADIKEYARRCVMKGEQSRLIEAIERDKEIVVSDVANLLGLASQVLQVELKDVPREAHYSASDIVASKFDSFLAELRCVVFLDKTGFENISFVEEANEPRPDILANYDEKEFIVEVATADRDSIRVFTCGSTVTINTKDRPFWRIDDSKPGSIIHYCLKTYDKKKEQLEWPPEGGAYHRMLVFVLNNIYSKGDGPPAVYANTLKELYDTIGKPANTHFSFVTGMTNSSAGKPDDCIWPPLS